MEGLVPQEINAIVHLVVDRIRFHIPAIEVLQDEKGNVDVLNPETKQAFPVLTMYDKDIHKSIGYRLAVLSAVPGILKHLLKGLDSGQNHPTYNGQQNLEQGSRATESKAGEVSGEKWEGTKH